MTEAEMFAAYRTLAGYQAECLCGTWITAPATATPEDVATIVRVHNESTEHVQFSAEQAAVLALRRQPVHICKCHHHGGN